MHEITKEYIKQYGCVKINSHRLNGMDTAFKDFLELVPRMTLDEAKKIMHERGERAIGNLLASNDNDVKDWHGGYYSIVCHLTGDME